jgi:(S)-2-hydroxyglutarate dehydrogenase
MPAAGRSHRPDKADVLVVGAGIVGLSIARSLAAAGCDNVVVLEKEARLGAHASGRNSGVLHAGIYYAPDSLKARSCLRGNALMRAYCREKGLPLRECGKVVVARGEEELPVLDELRRRAAANGARVTVLDEQELAGIEPFAKTFGKALFAHDTAVIDPQAVLESLRVDLEDSGRTVLVTGCAFKGLAGSGKAATTRGVIAFDRFVNAAGAHSDRVAHLLGVGRRFRIIPFKGVYRKLRAALSDTVRGNIYPVPDLRNPFLGVHFTRSVHGDVHIGPTAIPAFGRENYGVISGIDAEGFSIALSDAVLFLRNPRFREIALTETRKYGRGALYRDAARLVKGLSPEDIVPSDKVGIRPQLVDWETKELVMDFVVLADGGTVHVMNPISPAFTSAMDIADAVVREHFGASRA